MADRPDNWFAHPLVWAAGLAGAVVSLAHMAGLTLLQRLTAVVVGVLTAGFLTPAIADWFNLGASGVAAAGFLIGLGSMMLTAGAVNLFRRIAKDPTGLFNILTRGAFPTPAAPPPPVPPPPGPGGSP